MPFNAVTGSIIYTLVLAVVGWGIYYIATRQKAKEEAEITALDWASARIDRRITIRRMVDLWAADKRIEEARLRAEQGAHEHARTTQLLFPAEEPFLSRED